MNGQEQVLDIARLRVEFGTRSSTVVAARDVSLAVGRGEIVAVVGESGSGKSALAMSIAGLLPDNAVVRGEWTVAGARFSADGAMRSRPNGIGFIFQDPLGALNPAYKLGWQITEALRVAGASRAECRRRGIELLEQVGMTDPQRAYDLYPHEVSGGMRQRAVIAMALIGDPQLIIADEPTTALDVSVQKQVLDLLCRLVRDRNIGLLLITHDLAVVADVADRVLVMYAGSVVESGTAETVLRQPGHPYTRALLGCSLTLGSPRKTLIPEIAGTVPQLGATLTHCPFVSRCTSAEDQCRSTVPEAGDPRTRSVMCHFAKVGAAHA